MDNRDYRWIAGILLIAVFGVMAYGGGKVAPKAQGTQNVLVTNSAAQPIPVAARPGPGAAYIVAVSNAPSVKVVSSPTAPVVIKDANNTDGNSAINSGSFTVGPGNSGIITGRFALSSLPTIIDGISMHGQAVNAGESVDTGVITVYDATPALLGRFAFSIPVVQSGRASSYLGTVHIPVPANGSIGVEGSRNGGVTNNCYVDYSIAYHTVPNP